VGGGGRGKRREVGGAGGARDFSRGEDTGGGEKRGAVASPTDHHFEGYGAEGYGTQAKARNRRPSFTEKKRNTQKSL